MHIHIDYLETKITAPSINYYFGDIADKSESPALKPCGTRAPIFNLLLSSPFKMFPLNIKRLCKIIDNVVDF
jgi:hypothetical protein